MMTRINRGCGGGGFPDRGAIAGGLSFLEMSLGGGDGIDDLLTLSYHPLDLLGGVVTLDNGFLDPRCQVGRPSRLRRDAAPCRSDKQIIPLILRTRIKPAQA